MTYHLALAALADDTRRSLFERLRDGPVSVGDLAAGMPISRPAVSQHLKVLDAAGLVTVRSQGTRRLYAVRPEGLAELRYWLEAFWDDVLTAYREALEDDGTDSREPIRSSGP